MKEDKIYKDLPQVIDVEVEPDIDFELREPEDDERSEETTYVEEIIEVEATENTTKKTTDTNETYRAENKKEEKKEKKDTSFTTFKANQQAGERKWRRKVGSKIKKVFLILLMLIVGIPLLGFGGFFAVIGVGMAIFICGAALGMGVLGLGASAFMISAEMVGLGPIMFFISLVGIGGGGLGLLLIWAILMGIKCVVVKTYGYIRHKMTQEVA